MNPRVGPNRTPPGQGKKKTTAAVVVKTLWILALGVLTAVIAAVVINLMGL